MITRSNIEHCDHWGKIRTIILSYLSGAFPDKKYSCEWWWYKTERQDKVNLIWSLYVKSQPIASTSNTTFWWALQTQTVWVIFEPVRTHHLGLKAQNFENSIFIFGCFSLKAVNNYCKLQTVLQVVKFLIMHSFTHTNIVFLLRPLPNEIVIFINVCYQMKCFSGDSFFHF